MKVSDIHYVINKGGHAEAAVWQERLVEVLDAVQTVQWPPGSGHFVLNGIKQDNGVKPIKDACIAHLESKGWEPEGTLPTLPGGRAGLDAVWRTAEADEVYAVEWETGNISSSHRAMNKMCLGMVRGVLTGGVLILPTRAMYRFLTDRVGNLGELEPYFDMWEAVGDSPKIKEGFLAILAIEHDGIDPNVAKIAKGTDGRALV